MQTGSTAAGILSARIDDIEARDRPVRSLVAGDELVMVETGSDSAGVAMYPEGPVPDVADRSAIELVRNGAATTDPQERAIGVAALNAIDPPEAVRSGLDPFDALEPGVERVSMVGLFGPVVKRLDAATVDVFERDPRAIDLPEDLPADLTVRLHPPEDAAAIIPETTVSFITGSTLVYGGLGGYLDAATPDQTVVLVGASASFTPKPFFKAGVSLVGGASVSDPDHVREAITAGGSEADLHEGGLKKWAIVDPEADALSGLDLG